MLNLLRMNMRRLHHSLSTWVIVLCTVLTAVFCVTMTNLDISEMQKSSETAAASGSENVIGIYVSADPSWADADSPIFAEGIFAAEIGSGLLIILCAVLTSIYINAMNKHGYIKNIAGHYPKRTALVLADFLGAVLAVTALFLIFIMTITITGRILWGSRFVINNVSEMLGHLFGFYMIHIGFAVLAMLLVTLTKSASAGITVPVLLACGLGMAAYSIINYGILKIIPSSGFDISRYTLDANLFMLRTEASGDMLLHSIGVSLGFIVICVLLCLIIVKKRDIR